MLAVVKACYSPDESDEIGLGRMVKKWVVLVTL